MWQLTTQSLRLSFVSASDDNDLSLKVKLCLLSFDEELIKQIGEQAEQLRGGAYGRLAVCIIFSSLDDVIAKYLEILFLLIVLFVIVCSHYANQASK